MSWAGHTTRMNDRKSIQILRREIWRCDTVWMKNSAPWSQLQCDLPVCICNSLYEFIFELAVDEHIQATKRMWSVYQIIYYLKIILCSLKIAKWTCQSFPCSSDFHENWLMFRGPLATKAWRIFSCGWRKQPHKLQDRDCLLIIFKRGCAVHPEEINTWNFSPEYQRSEIGYSRLLNVELCILNYDDNFQQ